MIELLLQAERALTMGMVDQAERLYRQAVAADPRNSIAVVGLARVAIERTDDEGALREARRALVIDPENVAAARLAARLQQVLGYPSSSAPVATPGDASVTSPPVVRPTPAVTPAPAPRQGVVDRLLREESPVKVLVTGGAGYVGGVSVDAILAAGHDVVVLDDLSTGHTGSVHADARLVAGSYGDEAATRALMETEQVDAILHCAARSLVGESVRDPARYYRDNVAGGVALLEAARAAGVRRVVFSSTAAVYGTPESTPIPEDAVLRPINTYGETKRTFEGALHWYGMAYGFRSVILRYFNVAGATERLGEVHRPETHLIPNVLLAAEGGPALTLFGDDYPTPDGTPIRDYLHVSDLADAHLAALEATLPEATAPEATAPGDARTGPAGGAAPAAPLICNLGTSNGFSVREVLRASEAVVGRPIPHTLGPRREGDPPVLVASNARAREVLRWAARRSTLDEMIGSALAWRRSHPGGYGD